MGMQTRNALEGYGLDDLLLYRKMTMRLLMVLRSRHFKEVEEGKSIDMFEAMVWELEQAITDALND
jgi:hypothetical protein